MPRVKADFSSVEDTGRIRVPEADYRVRVANTKSRDSQAGNSMIVWTFEFLDSKFAGKTIWDQTTLTPRSLWRLKKLLEAMGVKVPRRAVSIDTRKYHGEQLGITVADDEYEERNGKTRVVSKIVDFLDVNAVSEVDDDDEPKVTKKKGKKNKKNKERATSGDDDDEIETLDLDDEI